MHRLEALLAICCAFRKRIAISIMSAEVSACLAVRELKLFCRRHAIFHGCYRVHPLTGRSVPRVTGGKLHFVR